MADAPAQKDPRIIDGVAWAAVVRKEVEEEVNAIKAAGKAPPGLGVVLVGERKDSASYVRMKEQACLNAGMHFDLRKLPADATEEDVMKHGSSLDSILFVRTVSSALPHHA
jgi:5,10-methylene-tetrahydrofolate dehydrogenase/methenyl tetrahydrofolate cyclohydrolase